MFLEFLLPYQAQLTTLFFFASYSIVALGEALRPRRKLTQPMGLRWATNIALYVVNVVISRMMFPVVLVALAIMAENRGWGLFNNLELPFILAMTFSLVILDFRAWFAHFLLHNIPLLWRLHLVHHSDPDYDFSIGLRFHPFDAIFTTVTEALIILAMGAPPVAVLLYKLLSLLMAAFVHGNLHIPYKIDLYLRKVLVTPDIHRIHHSAIQAETNSNYGGVTPWWDRLFGTYVDQPRTGHGNLEIGLIGVDALRSIKLHHVLLQPFTASTREPYPSNDSVSTKQSPA